MERNASLYDAVLMKVWTAIWTKLIDCDGEVDADPTCRAFTAFTAASCTELRSCSQTDCAASYLGSTRDGSWSSRCCPAARRRSGSRGRVCERCPSLDRAALRERQPGGSKATEASSPVPATWRGSQWAVSFVLMRSDPTYRRVEVPRRFAMLDPCWRVWEAVAQMRWPVALLWG